jgi:hypothetical protein
MKANEKNIVITVTLPLETLSSVAYLVTTILYQESKCLNELGS